MDISIALTEGNPRSLGRAEEVVAYVLAHPAKINELFSCLLSEDEIVRMRAGDALEKVCRFHPEWLRPYIDQLLTEVASIDQPSVQWHLVQMIGELGLTGKKREQALGILKHNLETANDWIVLNYSLEVFAQFVKTDASLRDYFHQQLEKHAYNPHKSVAKRAKKLLATA